MAQPATGEAQRQHAQRRGDHQVEARAERVAGLRQLSLRTGTLQSAKFRYMPALQVLEIANGEIGEFTFFLSTERLFPLFGLPARLDT